MSQVPALAGLLRQMGFTWSTADEVTNAVEALGIRGARSDDVAAALLRWRADGVNAALGRARGRLSREIASYGGDHNFNVKAFAADDSLDVEGQMALFNTSDERNRLAAALNAQRNGK